MTAHGDPRPVPSTGGVTLALHDLGGAGPPLLLAHPTGFHGQVWAPVATALAKHTERHMWAPDFRGHGDSPLAQGGQLHTGNGPAWTAFAEDVLSVVAALEAQGHSAPLVAAGHSMGGAALLQAEQLRPGTFAGLWLFEPIVFPTGPGGPVAAAVEDNPMALAALRRRAVFADRAAAFTNYATKPPLNSLAPDALEAYVNHGFADLPDGTVTLKCRPEVEAQVFAGGSANGIFDDLAKVECPVTVAASGDGGYPAHFAPQVAEALPDSRVEQFDELTHFGPMEAPDMVAAAIDRALQSP